jgi:hypothetical protein
MYLGATNHVSLGLAATLLHNQGQSTVFWIRGDDVPDILVG